MKGYGKSLYQLIDKLPKCQNGDEAQCFHEVKIYAEKGMQVKPCIKLQYKTKCSTWSIDQKNQAVIEMKFLTPARVTVKEEYLIYDLVAVVSAIGGTMGLCIGFSFRDFFGSLLEFLELAIKRYSAGSLDGSNPEEN